MRAQSAGCTCAIQTSVRTSSFTCILLARPYKRTTRALVLSVTACPLIQQVRDMLSLLASPMTIEVLNTKTSNSASPEESPPSRDLKGIKLFRAISKKLAHKSKDVLSEEDSNSSGSYSSSSTSVGRRSRSKKPSKGFEGFNFWSLSPRATSSSSINTSTSDHQKLHQKQSTSVKSISRVFQNLRVKSLPHSSSRNKDKRNTGRKDTLKILRQPVTYIYVKGLSGLPTQRVPIQRVPKTVYRNNSCNSEVHRVFGHFQSTK